MAGKVYDRQTLVVDRSPLKQLAVEVGKFKPQDPFTAGQQALNFVEDYLIDAFKSATGIDFGFLKDGLDVLGDLFGMSFLTSNPPGSHPGLDSSIITSGTFGIDMIDGLLPLLDGIPGVPELLSWFGLDTSGNSGTITEWADSLLHGGSALNAGNLAGLIPSNLLGMIPYSNIGDAQPELLTNGGFTGAVSIGAGGGWSYDAGVGRMSPGSAKLTFGGANEYLRSNDIEVSAGQKLSVAVFAKWSGLVYTGTPFKLQIVRFLDFDVVGTDDVASPTAPAGTVTSWQMLSGAYTVPEGCDRIVLQLFGSATATAGSVNFDDGSAKKTGMLQMPWVENLDDAFGGLLDLLGLGALGDLLGTIDVGAIWTTIIGDIINPLGAIEDFLGRLGQQTLVDSVWSAFQKTIAFGKTPADVANAAAVVVNTAQDARDTGDQNSTVLAIRNNKSIYSDVDETSESTFPMTELANPADPSAPLNFAVTSTTSPMAFWRATETAKKGFLSWFGKGFANITALYVDVYKFDATFATLVKIHTSTNLVGLAGANFAYVIYQLPELDRIDVEPGDVFAFSLRLVGSGTHTIAGKQITWLPDHPTVIPARPAAVRASGNSNLAAGSITYSGNLAWFGFGITFGDIAPPAYQPRSTNFSTPGTSTYTPPSWYDPALHYLDVIALGGGAGGGGGVSGETSGSGGASTVSAGGTVLISGAGGAGVADGTGSHPTGFGPGDQFYLGTNYKGGPEAGVQYPGNAPGGGGGAGNYFGVTGKGGNAGKWAVGTLQPGTLPAGLITVTVGAGGTPTASGFGPGAGAKGSVTIVARSR